MTKWLGYCKVDEIMASYRYTRAYVYKLAHKHHWRRYRHPDGGVRYHRGDVGDTLSPSAALAPQVNRRVKSRTDHLAV